jgi:hypothetical protein
MYSQCAGVRYRRISCFGVASRSPCRKFGTSTDACRSSCKGGSGLAVSDAFSAAGSEGQAVGRNRTA